MNEQRGNNTAKTPAKGSGQADVHDFSGSGSLAAAAPKSSIPISSIPGSVVPGSGIPGSGPQSSGPLSSGPLSSGPLSSGQPRVREVMRGATVAPPASQKAYNTLGDARIHSARPSDSVPTSAVSSSGMRSQLKISCLGTEEIRVLPLDQPQQVIGRGEEAHVMLDHGTVSRVHAQLVRGPFGHWWVYDLGSTNGTFVNGSRVYERLISPGDAIGIGDYTLILNGTDIERGADAFADTADVNIAPTESQRSGVPTQAHRTMVMSAEPMDARRLSAMHLSGLMNLSRELLRIESGHGRRVHVCRYMVGKAFPANHAAVVRVRPAGRDNELFVGPIKRTGRKEQMSPLSRSVVASLVETRAPVLATNIGASDNGIAIGGIDLTMSKQVREVAIIACPLFERDGDMYCLYLEFPASYATSEWLTLVTFVGEITSQADAVWDMRENVRGAASLESELEMARQIQDGLVPRDLDELGSMDVAVGYQPCRWVGGDYIDVIKHEDGRILLAIADVCGKGMQAALVASSLHTLVRATADSNRSLSELMERFNDYFCRYLPEHSFVTMLTVLFDPASGELEIVNAGHPPALVLNRFGHNRPLQSEENVPLGLVEAEMRSSREDIQPGEVLLLYTDGLSEAIDDQSRPLGVVGLGAGLGGILTNRPNITIEELRDLFTDRVESFTKGEVATDDRTFLVARRR